MNAGAVVLWCCGAVVLWCCGAVGWDELFWMINVIIPTSFTLNVNFVSRSSMGYPTWARIWGLILRNDHSACNFEFFNLK
jgi:hypothetical protein